MHLLEMEPEIWFPVILINAILKAVKVPCGWLCHYGDQIVIVNR